MADFPFSVRPLRPNRDEGLIYASWLRAHEPDRDLRVPKDIYYQEQHELVRRLLQQDTFLVAALNSDPDLIFGWLAGIELPIGRVLDYVYVKPIYRRCGVAKSLLAAFGSVDAFTHYGTTVVPGKLVPGAVFDPYLLHLYREPQPRSDP